MKDVAGPGPPANEKTIHRLPKLPATAAAKLRADGVLSIEGLWRRLDGEENDASFDKNLAELAKTSGLSEEDWLEILADSAVEESELDGQSRLWAALHRHVLDLALLLVPVILLCLAVRAVAPIWRQEQKVCLAARSLAAGEVLQAQDLRQSRWPPAKPGQVTEPRDAEGLVLRYSVPAGAPLRFEDLLRMQVVTVRTVSWGNTVSREAVTRRWTPYEAQAFLDLDQVVGREALQRLPAGTTVLSGTLGPAGPDGQGEPEAGKPVPGG